MTQKTRPASAGSSFVRASERHRALVALVFVQLFFGLHYFAAKIVLLEVPPRTWAALRAGSAAVLLLAATVALRRRLPAAPRDWAILAGFSLFGVILNQLGFVEGLARTTASHASILMTGIPVMVLVFAVALGHERLTGRKLLSLAVALAGVLLVVSPKNGGGAGSPTLLGDVLILANASSYAFFLVISKRVIARLDALGATAVLMLFGALGLGIVGAPQLARFEPAAVSATAWGWAAFAVVFPTSLGYMLNYYALKRVDASVVGLFIYLQPVIATGLGAMMLGERPTAGTLAGALLIFAGVYLALRRQPPSSASAASSAAPTGRTDSSMSNSGE